MWTRFGGEIIIARNTAWGFVARDRKRLLPVISQGKKAYMIRHTKITENKDCSNIHVIAQQRIEMQCVFCLNVMRCAIGSNDLNQFKLHFVSFLCIFEKCTVAIRIPSSWLNIQPFTAYLFLI